MTELFDDVAPPEGVVRINGRYSVAQEDDLRVVFAGGLPLLDFHVSDIAGRDLAIAQLAEHGGVGEHALADAFGVSRATVARAKSTLKSGGVPARVPRKRGPKGPSKLKGRKKKLMASMVRQGMAKRAIARRLGESERAVRDALKRLGPNNVAGSQPSLPQVDSSEQQPANASSAQQQEPVTELPDAVEDTSCEPAGTPVQEAAVATQPPGDDDEPSADEIADAEATEQPTPTTDSATSATGTDEPSEIHAGVAPVTGPSAVPSSAAAVELPVERTSDTDPDNRLMDRVFARLGLLDDAAPLFGTRRNVPRAGLLLAVPLLTLHGVFADAVKLFGNIGPAFYGVRTTVMSLLLMFLARINRPEHLKEHSPWALGAVLGLDRFPEMKTLRRKIRALAAKSRSLQFMKSLCERHLARLQATHLWLYIDGHVSVYSGKRKLKKHHVTRLRISLPSILDYWVNDERGDPLLVVTGAPRKMMVSLIPKQISQLRDQGEKRPITIAFDREGWSPQMFAKLDAMPDVYFVSYRKAQANKKLPRLTARAFSAHEAQVGGKTVAYQLSDNGIHVGYGRGKARKRLHLRQVTRLSDNGHQTHVVTNDRSTGAFAIAHRMFGRWGQENFFKYVGEEMDLDGLYTYEMDDSDGERMVANVERKKLVKEAKRLEANRAKLMAEYGNRALQNEEKQRPTMRGFKIANGTLAERIRSIDVEFESLAERIAALPAKVTVKERLNGEQPKQVHVEMRRLIHCFRIASFRAESALRELLRPHYRRCSQDGRTIIQSMLQSSGDLEVADNELHVALEPQSAPHHTRALAALCEDLNRLDTKFPGSALRLRFSVREAENAS
jgi:transposase